MTTTETCKKCGQTIKDGELVTGLSWNGDGGEHIECPAVETSVLEVGYVPTDANTGVYEMTDANPYFGRASGKSMIHFKEIWTIDSTYPQVVAVEIVDEKPARMTLQEAKRFAREYCAPAGVYESPSVSDFDLEDIRR